MKYLAIVLLMFGATACAIQHPVSEAAPVNNADYKVAYLFEHDGCKVYRFYDQGHYVYFTSCKGEAIARVDSATLNRNMTVLEKPAAGTGNH